MCRYVVLLAALAACGGGGGDPMDPPEHQFGTVRGRVLATGDTALQNVAIGLTRTGHTNRNATTDASGNFTLANVETGAWTVTATAPAGYEAAASLTATATVTANQAVDVPPFRMRRINVPPPPPPPPPPPSSATVEIRDNLFDPGSVTIAAGGTVTWTNAGTVQHNSTSSTGIWTSPNLNPGAEYQRTFPAAGTFTYACTLHAGMTGTVVVQ